MNDDLMNQRLSQVLGGFGQTGQMFHLASKLIKNKDAKTMLNLMSMATGAAATTKDPMTLAQTMRGPMSDIVSSMTEEQKQKRMSDIMPPVRHKQPGGAPKRTPVYDPKNDPNSDYNRRIDEIFLEQNNRLESAPTEEELRRFQ